jgi:hypothetical protein
MFVRGNLKSSLSPIRIEQRIHIDDFGFRIRAVLQETSLDVLWWM